MANCSGVDDAFTKSLLHMDTTFTDESGKVWTANGNAQIDTAQSKFGGASGLFDGTGDYIETPYTADHNTGAGDLTVDSWVRFNSVATIQTLFARRTSNPSQQDLFSIYWYQPTGRLYFHAISSTVTRAEYSFAWTPSTATWYHIAIVRNGTNLYMFLNGVSQSLTVGTAVSTNNLDPTFGNPVSVIGRYGNYNDFYMNGWIDEFRFSKGIARWTANFIPPTSEYCPGTSTRKFQRVSILG